MDVIALSELIGLPTNTIPVIATLAAAAVVSIRDDKRATNQEKKDAEIAFMKAFTMTEKYYSYLNQGGAKTTEREYDIANAWGEASIYLRKFNKKLSKQLGYKSQFWLDGEAWSEDQIYRAGISLESVRDSGLVTFKA